MKDSSDVWNTSAGNTVYSNTSKFVNIPSLKTVPSSLQSPESRIKGSDRVGSSYRMPIKISKGSQLGSPVSKGSQLDSPTKDHFEKAVAEEEKSSHLEEKEYYEKLKALKADQVHSS